MFDLTDAIGRWRKSLARAGSLRGGDLEELESHLREEIACLVGAGLTEEEAFWVGARRMGDSDRLSEEFAKVHPEAVWAHRFFWMAAGLLLYHVAAKAAAVASGAGACIGALAGLDGYGLGAVCAAGNAVLLVAALFALWIAWSRYGLGALVKRVAATRRGHICALGLFVLLVLGLSFLAPASRVLLARLVDVETLGEAGVVQAYGSWAWSILLPLLLGAAIVRHTRARQVGWAH